MSAEENRATVRRMFDMIGTEVFGKKNLQALDALVAPDVVYHDQSAPIRGLDGYREMMRMYVTAFPDARFTIEHQVAEGDTVVTLFSVTGTHQGDLLGIPPSGKTVTLQVLTLMRLRDGKLVEEWERFDSFSLFHQIGQIPALAAATT